VKNTCEQGRRERDAKTRFAVERDATGTPGCYVHACGCSVLDCPIGKMKGSCRTPVWKGEPGGFSSQGTPAAPQIQATCIKAEHELCLRCAEVAICRRCPSRRASASSKTRSSAATVRSVASQTPTRGVCSTRQLKWPRILIGVVVWQSVRDLLLRLALLLNVPLLRLGRRPSRHLCRRLSLPPNLRPLRQQLRLQRRLRPTQTGKVEVLRLKRVRPWRSDIPKVPAQRAFGRRPKGRALRRKPTWRIAAGTSSKKETETVAY
jgi:hypothetical protein